ncbi:hypothetical protein FIV42_18925 [Persicimonas caeni]|uniref:DUF1795 domain-containing protein n=1 Tax=Persicimonas caeni TaxID=2292766 RepID=A0A4Y6PWN6_PERCE|nr:hypothetical protein [Persicimonas caeni]QDG52738.1 hypothetical protein FIV42_18925 [Persicimonas caeni]QED33960.1 hypothetical protein FRD00_18920 [Persicimonas caeni]
MRYYVFFAAALVAFAAACETSKPERPETSTSPAEAAALSEDEATRLVARAETLRDRTFERKPELVAVSSADDLGSPPALPQPVATERRLLLEQLFGVDSTPSQTIATPPFRDLARYDAETNRVLYLGGHTRAPQREAAILAALVEGIDAQHFDPMPTPSSWDEHLAVATAQNATVSLALTHHLLDAHHPELDVTLVTDRPALATELPVLTQWLRATGAQDATPTVRIRARERALLQREGWALAAALYRSSGWSGVELTRLMPPKRSSDVVRPDQWMGGEPVGDWTWPEDAKPTQAGLVGPSIAAMWLEDVIDPRLARTVYAGYVSDAYRVFDATEDAPARFEWLSLWDTPESARQVARAFEKRLRQRFANAKDADAHFVVFQQGLKVGVLLSKEPGAKKRERAQHLLESHTVKLTPRQGLPTSFEPTRRDELVQTMQKATLDERVWRDPATGLELDLSMLGDDWKVQQPDHGPVRWFAQHRDGSLLQLTVELGNPLGPDFASDAYRKRLVDALQATVQQAKLEEVAPTDLTPTRGLTVRVSGNIDKTARKLQLWHFRRDDLIVSYSLQAMPKSFEAHRKLAASILDRAETFESGTPAKQSTPGSGTIEYEVEDE